MCTGFNDRKPDDPVEIVLCPHLPDDYDRKPGLLGWCLRHPYIYIMCKDCLEFHGDE